MKKIIRNIFLIILALLVIIIPFTVSSKVKEDNKIKLTNNIFGLNNLNSSSSIKIVTTIPSIYNAVSEITKLFFDKRKYVISDELVDTIVKINDTYKTNRDYANARQIRNIVDQIIMNQNLRTIEEFSTEISLEDVNTYINENGIDISESIKKLIDFDFNKLLGFYTCYNDSIETQDFDDVIVSIFSDSGQGTGFIISPDGLCLSCAHCINNNAEDQSVRFKIKLPNNKRIDYIATLNVIAKDETNDLCLFKINFEDFEFRYLCLDFNYIIKPLSEFLMVGYPFGGQIYKNLSYTTGKIASINMIEKRKTVFADMFGVPGNSGSPVVDILSNKVIGLFWGGITSNNEIIHCFTPIDIIEDFLKNIK